MRCVVDTSNKGMSLAWTICQNEDLKSAVVGLHHNSLKIFPFQGRMNFLLTVLTDISDPKLVFGFHSSHVVMCVLIHLRPMDWTLADKVLKKTPLDLQKRFPKNHACTKILDGLSLRLGILRERLSIPPGSRKSGKNAD